MALKTKFAELYSGPIELRRKRKGIEETAKVTIRSLEKSLRRGWRIVGMDKFDYSFRAFLAWAFDAALLPDDLPITIEEIENGFNNKFVLEIFPEQAISQGLMKEPCSLGDVQACWNRLTEKQQAHGAIQSAFIWSSSRISSAEEAYKFRAA